MKYVGLVFLWAVVSLVARRLRGRGYPVLGASVVSGAVLLSIFLVLRLPASSAYQRSASTQSFDIAAYADSVKNIEWDLGRHGGSINLTVTSEPDTWNFYTSNSSPTSVVLLRVFEAMVEKNAFSQRFEPRLAERWEASGDGLTWTFFLRQDVVWQDGEPLTARDVEFTFNDIIYNREVRTGSRQLVSIEVEDEETGEVVEKKIAVKALDDYTVEFVFPVRYRIALEVLSRPIMPRHLLLPAIQEGTFNEFWDIGTSPREIIGSGPFRLDSYVASERVTLVRNERYWKTDRAGEKVPYLDRVNYRVVSDIESRTNFFKAGQTDYLEMSASAIAELGPLQERRGFTISRLGPAMGQSFLAINLNTDSNPDSGDPYVPEHKQRWFNNLKFRKALAFAIHKPSLIDLSQFSLGYSQWGPMSPSAGFFFNPDVPKYHYDPQRSREILDSLGWVDRDGDGIREDDQGVPIEFVIYKPAGGATIYINVIREDWAAIGLDIHVQDVEWTNLIRRLDTEFNWDVAYLGFTGSEEPHLGKALWVSASPFRMWHPAPQGDLRPWEREIERIFREAVLTLERDEAKRLYDRWQYLAAENLPFIHTTLSERLFAISDRYGNVIPSPYGATLYAAVLHNLPYVYERGTSE